VIALALGGLLVEVPGGLRGAQGAEAAGDIAALLPRAGEVAGWAPDGSAQAAAGQELFALINGGAEVFLQAGFDRAVTQAYRGDGDRRVDLEIYRMRTPQAADAVFRQKTAGGEPPIPLGAGGSRGEYYILFWQDRFLVTATGSDAGQETMSGVERIARLVEEKISQVPR
jgi:hypothetical protein